MPRERTFAYLLMASAWSKEIEAEVSGCSRGDVLELFMEREEQAQAPDHLWGFGWDDPMSRIAPVQLTYGWDLRPYLSTAFAEAGVEPCFAKGSGEDRDGILY